MDHPIAEKQGELEMWSRGEPQPGRYLEGRTDGLSGSGILPEGKGEKLGEFLLLYGQ